MKTQKRDIEVHYPQNSMFRSRLPFCCWEKRNVRCQDSSETVSQQDYIQIIRFMR